MQEILLPQARLPVADDLQPTGAAGRNALADALDAGPSAGATLNLIQEALQELDHPLRLPAMPKDPGNADVTVHTNTPPPPFRGALPAAQPIASPSIAPDAPLETTAHHLLENTDAAIARQTLLQVASLPDRIDLAESADRHHRAALEFRNPVRDAAGHGDGAVRDFPRRRRRHVEAAKRVWRARFSLDVEPAGPVHALVSLSGEKTSVRMWAERPATAAQLRAGAAQLSQALSRAELNPGDIVVQDGAPQQAAAARVGHFLDRAL